MPFNSNVTFSSNWVGFQLKDVMVKFSAFIFRLICFSLAFTGLTFHPAFSVNSPSDGKKLLALAKAQYERYALDSALINYDKAARILKTDPNSAKEYMESRVGIERIMLGMNALSNVRQYLKEDRKFINKHFKPVSEEMRLYYLILGEVYFAEKDVENIQRSFQKARKISEKLYGPESMKSAQVYYNIGKNHLFMGQFDSAAVYSHKALKNLHKNPEPWKDELASGIYNVAGYRFRARHFSNPENAGKPVMYQGKKYPSNLHIYLAYLDSALITETYLYGKDGGNSGKVYYNMATAYVDLYQESYKQPTANRREPLLKSLNYLNKALTIHYQRKDREIGIVYALLAHLYNTPELYDPEKAAENYLLALKASLPGYKGKSLYEVPEIRNVQSINFLAQILHNISQFFDSEYQDSPDNIKLMEMRYQYSLKGIELAQYMDQRIRYFEKDNNTNSLNVNYRKYGQAIADAYELYQKTGQEKYKAEAFRIAETFKSYNLLQSSLQTRLDQMLESRKKLADDYRELVNRVVRYEEQTTMVELYPMLARNPVFGNAQKNLTNAEKELDAFINKVKEGAPDFYQEKVEQNYALTLAQAQKEVAPNSVSISYFGNSHYHQEEQAFVFLIHPDKTDFLKIVLPAKYDAQIATLVKSITTSEIGTYRKSGNDLYNLLLKPVLAKTGPNVRKLVIMPDGYIWQIPFEALLTQPTTTADYRKMPFLFKQYQVSYQHSATLGKLFKEQAENQRGTHSKTILAMAPFADKNLATDIAAGKINLMSGSLSDGNYAKLPYTIQLMQELERKVEGLFLIDKDATEENFKKNAGNFSIIHLATHAETDYYNPFQSKFLLAKGSQEDGNLFMSELLNMNIKPSLAVLSACETGVGKVDAESEGMTSLSWCFNYLGCPSTVSTLWKVDDRQTSILLKGFYDNLFAGKNKNEAFQLAKLGFVQNARTSDEANPFYWSGMVLIGDDGFLNLPTKPWWERWQFWVIGGGSILLLISLLMIWKNRKAKYLSQTRASQNVVLNR